MILTPRIASVMSVLLSTAAMSPVQAASDEVSAARAWASQALLGKTIPEAQPVTELGPRAPFSFVYAGIPSSKFLSSWRVATTHTPPADGREKHAITYTDPATGLQVICELTLFSDFPAAEWVLYFRNTGNADTPIIENIQPLDLGITVPKDSNVVLHRSNGSRLEPVDFLPSNQPVAAGADIHLAPNEWKIVGRRAWPFFNLQWNCGGLVGAIGWSGQWAMQLRRDAANGLTLQAGQQTVHLKLHSGERIRTPRILLTIWRGADQMHGHNLFRTAAHGTLPAKTQRPNCDCANGIDRLVQLQRRKHLQRGKTNSTGSPRAQRPAWNATGWTQAGLRGAFPMGQVVGCQNPRIFLADSSRLGDAAHKQGMKFILWFEPERVNPNTRIAKEHPQWVLHADPKNRVFDVFHPGDGLFNLGDPAARLWLTDYLSNCIRDWNVDVFRNDFNIDPLCFWKAADLPDRQGMAEIRYVEGLYQLWDDLVQRNPKLTIDNCASGGRRIDLETVSRSYPLWRSDTACLGPQSKPLFDQIQVAGLSLYVPQHCGGVCGESIRTHSAVPRRWERRFVRTCETRPFH